MKIISKGLNKNMVTVTIQREGMDDAEVTRPVPDSTLQSQVAFDNYMKIYLAGLQIEFPETPVSEPVEIKFSTGELLNPVSEVDANPII